MGFETEIAIAKEEQKKIAGEEFVTQPDSEDFNTFWYSELANKSGDKRWKIDHRKLIGFIHKNGFRRFDIGTEYIFVRIRNKVIEEVQVTTIQDEVMKYVNDVPVEKLTKSGISKTELVGKFYTSPAIFFNERKLSLLGTENGMIFNSDTKEACFIYYLNGFVKCTSDGYELQNYKYLDRHIFRNQVKDREFQQHSSEGMFSTFVYNISEKNDIRFEALQTMIGYLQHGYFNTKMKAVNLTDSSISDVAEGRTGKTLLGYAIAKIKNLCEIPGKDFDPANKHKYATASLDTQIVFLNDLRKHFNFESLFNDISDSITVDRKNLQPFQIKVKMLISSNSTFRVEGASAKDRVMEFELSDHYSNKFSPKDEFNVSIR